MELWKNVEKNEKWQYNIDINSNEKNLRIMAEFAFHKRKLLKYFSERNDIK